MKIRSQEVVLLAIVVGLAALIGYAYFVTRSAEEGEEMELALGPQRPSEERPEAVGEPPCVELAEESFDFGTIEPDQAVEHAFSIRNTGTGTLEIEGHRTSCSCVTVEMSSYQIEPGTSADLIAKLDPQHFGGFSPRIKAYVYTNDAAHHLLSLLVSAEIVPEFVIEPKNIDFGTVEKGQGASQNVRLKQTWREPLSITGIETSAESISAFYSEVPKAAEDDSVPGAAEYEVEVRLDPDAPGGVINGYVLMRTNIKRLAAVRLPVRAFVVGGVHSTPELLFFVARPPDGNVGAVDIYGDVPFALADIESDIEGVAWERGTLGLQQRHRILGTLEPDARPGERSGSVTVKLSRASPEELVVPVAGVVLEKDSAG